MAAIDRGTNMSRAFSDIAFTPSVRELQTRMGSRSQYEAFDRATDRRDRLTEREAKFIRHSDHFFQATVGETGWPYVQHRGGPSGFLEVLDDRTIAYADFRGNVQYISVGNLTRDDRVSLILMDYAHRRRLKILGRARIVEAAEDPELIARVTVPGYTATVERAVVIGVEAWDWNCPQHITQRFTVAEVQAVVAPLQAEIERLRARIGEQA